MNSAASASSCCVQYFFIFSAFLASASLVCVTVTAVLSPFGINAAWPRVLPSTHVKRIDFGAVAVLMSMSGLASQRLRFVAERQAANTRAAGAAIVLLLLISNA